MSVIQTAMQNLKTANRRILVTGPRGSGKTTLSVSASRHAGDTIGGGERKCDDVLVIQGDNEGVMGAMDAGLTPGFVLDTTGCRDWDAYCQCLAAGLRELQKPLLDGTIKVVIIDLAWPAKLIDESITDTSIARWGQVAKQGTRLFRALAGLKGVTVIGNAQIKASVSPTENDVAANASTAKAIGGERSTFTIDLPKGISSMWLDNCSFVLVRDSKRIKDARGEYQRTFRTLTQSNMKFEAKSRAGSKLKPTEDGNKSLFALLSEAYGESL